MTLNSLNQYNETRACDSCRTLNIRCVRDVTRSTMKCTQCIEQNQECTYFNPEDPPNNNEIFCGLSSEEIKYFKNMYTKEQL
ncbi:39775_t:CDS:1, partial [Gigaspora margarita]